MIRQFLAIFEILLPGLCLKSGCHGPMNCDIEVAPFGLQGLDWGMSVEMKVALIRPPCLDVEKTYSF